MSKNLTFQLDNDPKQMSKSVMTWLQKREIKMLKWPSHSLNPFQSQWNDLKRDVHKRSPHSLKELELFCNKEWDIIL